MKKRLHIFITDFCFKYTVLEPIIKTKRLSDSLRTLIEQKEKKRKLKIYM